VTICRSASDCAAVRRRFGYRRLGWLLAREGHAMNHKKLYRIYHEEKLMVRQRRGRKRAVGTRARCCYRPGLINAGVSTSSATRSATAAAFVSCASSMISAANV
jgi:hypothetical protein